MSELDSNNLDRLTSLAKGVVGACPVIGSLVSEVVGSLIPNQRLDRVVEYLKALDLKVSQIDSGLEKLQSNLKSPEGLDLFEDGLLQASRAVSKERIGQLACLIGQSLTEEKIRYSESKKLLNLFRELTDPEILWLYFYANNPTIGYEFHKKLMADNPDVLMPISREIGAPQEQQDRAAIQDSYKITLLRHGLIIEGDNLMGKSRCISNLGRLLVRYIAINNEYNTESE